MLWGTQAFNGRMLSDHSAGHGIAGMVGIKAAIYAATLFDEMVKPEWLWSGACGRDAAVVWMERKAADGIDGGLTEDNIRVVGIRDREVAEIFT